MGTRIATFMLRKVTQRAVEKQRVLYMCFVNFEKAFDMVRHEVLMRILVSLGNDAADLRALLNLYFGQKSGSENMRGKEQREARLRTVTRPVFALFTNSYG